MTITPPPPSRLAFCWYGFEQRAPDQQDAEWRSRMAIPKRVFLEGIAAEANAAGAAWRREADRVPAGLGLLGFHWRAPLGLVNGVQWSYIVPAILKRDGAPAMHRALVAQLPTAGVPNILWRAGVRDFTRYCGGFNERDLSRYTLDELYRLLTESQEIYAQLWGGAVEYIDEGGIAKAGSLAEWCWLTLARRGGRQGIEPEAVERWASIKARPPMMVESRLFRDRLVSYGRDNASGLHPLLASPSIDIMLAEKVPGDYTAEYAGWLRDFPQVRLVAERFSDVQLAAFSKAVATQGG